MPKQFDLDTIQKHAEILSNRVYKNFRHLSRKFKKQNIDCYRLYDWDIPEVRAVVDWYAGHLVIAEYIREQTGPDWLPKMAEAVSKILNVESEKVHLKKRQTQTQEGPRYRKMGSKNIRFSVNERDLKFWINLDDYLDTGLFSDHRETRVLFKNLAAGHDFLNLYAYTGSFTCAAALGGAKSSVTVDRSATYIAWAKENMGLNKVLSPQHTFVQSDVDKYLIRAEKEGKRFSLCLIDPPSFYQDERNEISFDINRDHPDMLRAVLRIMKPGGTVFFSTNHQRFEPRLGDLPVKDLKEITASTIPEDYRNKQIHRCWQMKV